MKKLLFALAAAAVLAGTTQAADVAVMEIRFGKAKELKRVTIELFDADAPQTAENFRRLARKGFYDGLAFHRAIPGTFVQVGDPQSKHKERARVGTGGPGYTIPAEIRRKHEAGALSMARLPDKINPGRASNGSQFFVALKPLPDYDGKYTVFGKVTSGLEVLDQISRAGTDTNDYPVERIIIRRLRILPAEKA